MNIYIQKYILYIQTFENPLVHSRKYTHILILRIAHIHTYIHTYTLIHTYIATLFFSSIFDCVFVGSFFSQLLFYFLLFTFYFFVVYDGIYIDENYFQFSIEVRFTVSTSFFIIL